MVIVCKFTQSENALEPIATTLFPRVTFFKFVAPSSTEREIISTLLLNVNASSPVVFAKAKAPIVSTLSGIVRLPLSPDIL